MRPTHREFFIRHKQAILVFHGSGGADSHGRKASHIAIVSAVRLARTVAGLRRPVRRGRARGSHADAGSHSFSHHGSIQSGAIGPVRECHVWVSRAWGLQSKEAAARNKDIVAVSERPEGSPPPPSTLHWDLWLGPAPLRPFSDVYVPGPKWYRWWDFGNGTMSDLGSHWNDLPFWALKLDAPRTIDRPGLADGGLRVRRARRAAPGQDVLLSGRAQAAAVHGEEDRSRREKRKVRGALAAANARSRASPPARRHALRNARHRPAWRRRSPGRLRVGSAS